MTATLNAAPVSFDYMKVRVRDLRPVTEKKGEKTSVKHFTVDGREVAPTGRFWTSFFAKFGFGNSTFKYFDHHEVFDRISERVPSDTIRLCVESSSAENGDRKERLLAISNPASVLVKHDDLLNLLKDQGLAADNVDYGGRGRTRPRMVMTDGGHRLGEDARPGEVLLPGVDHGPATANLQEGRNEHGWVTGAVAVPAISYDTGLIRSIHAPRNVGDFDIAGDTFSNRFVMDTPIDGYGKPSIYLMLLRLICTNGAIGYSRAFRSDLSVGKGEDSFEYALTRAFEGYNNEDGFTALRQRYESAGKSWASINEINKTYKALVKLHHRGELRVDQKFLTDETSSFKDEDGRRAALLEGSPIIQGFNKLTKDLTQAYGLANLDALGVKRQRTLPAGCTMYELLNFVTEVATHHANPAGARAMQAMTGEFLAAEYDLEGTVDKFGDWKDFLISDAQAVESYALAQKA